MTFIVQFFKNYLSKIFFLTCLPHIFYDIFQSISRDGEGGGALTWEGEVGKGIPADAETPAWGRRRWRRAAPQLEVWGWIRCLQRQDCIQRQDCTQGQDFLKRQDCIQGQECLKRQGCIQRQNYLKRQDCIQRQDCITGLSQRQDWIQGQDCLRRQNSAWVWPPNLGSVR